MTYSIVARDQATGKLGVGVQFRSVADRELLPNADKLLDG
jgi:uncharacterized Ntn-hydrolase superfamily protein